MKVKIEMKETMLELPLDDTKSKTKVVRFRFNFLCSVLMDSEYDNIKGNMKKGAIHPTFALNNAKKDFILSKKEENIIASHMFPLGDVKPNCKESWIVTNVDKSVACYECGLHKWREKIAVMVIFLINLVRF